MKQRAQIISSLNNFVTCLNVRDSYAYLVAGYGYHSCPESILLTRTAVGRCQLTNLSLDLWVVMGSGALLSSASLSKSYRDA